MLAGTPSLRTPTGERDLEPGEVVAFPRGEQGAHQVINRTGERARILIVSEMNAPDVVVRPESNKISAFWRPLGAAGEGFHDVYFCRDAVELWDGEEPPRRAGERYRSCGRAIAPARASARSLLGAAPPLPPPRRERTGCALGEPGAAQDQHQPPPPSRRRSSSSTSPYTTANPGAR